MVYNLAGMVRNLILAIILSVGVVGAIYGLSQQATPIPQSVQAKYDEFAPVYGKSLGASLLFCKGPTEKVFVVQGSGGFVNQEYYYSNSGKIIGESFSSDMANDPENKLPPRDLNKYTCKALQKTN